MKRPTLLQSFSRAQVSSAAATVVDWGLLFILTEGLHVWYVVSVAIGAAAGSVTNFLINRHWSFQATHRGIHGQVFRYSLVAVGSLILNTAGVYVVTEWLHIHYFAPVVGVSLLVGFGFNYPLHHHFVFK